MTRGDYRGAAAEFERSLELKKQAMLRKPGDTNIMADIANSISWLAESNLKLGATQVAMRLYREEEAQLRPIAADNANWSSRLSLSLMRQSALSTALGDRDQAIRAMKDAQEIAHTLVTKDPSNRNWRVRMLQAQGRLIEVELTPQNAAISLERLQQVSEKLAELSKQDTKNTFITYLIFKFDLLRSTILQQLGRNYAAIRNTDETVAKLEQLAVNAKNDNQLRSYLAEGLLIRAELNPKDGQDAATAYCKRAIEVLAPFSDGTNDHTLLSLSVRAHLCAGKHEKVLLQINQLSKMGYHDARYQQYINSHTLLKGKQ
jgi:tetratricopeptide (TPR) repeat protein